MLPPKHTGFLLIPCHPNDRDRPIALHVLLQRIHLPHYACIGFVPLPEAIFRAHHTLTYPTTIRAIRMDEECRDLQDLSTVTGCITHGISSDSSACRHAVSLGLFVYHPSGPQRSRPTRQYPNGLSTHDLTIPIEGFRKYRENEIFDVVLVEHFTFRDSAHDQVAWPGPASLTTRHDQASAHSRVLLRDVELSRSVSELEAPVDHDGVLASLPVTLCRSPPVRSTRSIVVASVRT